ncbi:HAD-IIA family hydrolase [Ammoniphilus sp. 3BR4]|uniref:HAD-IIA family hydrolase n=1 Tax=Ammoniphilus sp. 3BR4 TaxID=3158265 RepID=UPI003467AE32
MIAAVLDNLSRLTTFILDLDGCIYSGNQLYPSAQELISFLQEEQKGLYFLTNNSTDRSGKIREKLLRMGLPAEEVPILVATELVGSYLAERYGRIRVHSIGSEDLEQSLRMAGHQVIPLESQEPCDFLVLGRDTSFTYQTLQACTRRLEKGVRLVTTNPDLYHPGEDGSRVPETGALIAAIQAVSGVIDVQSVGKPFTYPFDKVLQNTGAIPGNCVMVGDNPYTDILGGRSAGMFTVWISHGHSFPDHLGFVPDLTVDSVKELLETLQERKALNR